ncbi:MAG TPA: hypothetical protein VE715_12220 [Blastocatellia bacterium]|nr:hypothetical protein [Blastocatellia bacterium]
MKKTIFFGLGAALLIIAGAVVWAHEKVKLTGYVVDVVCFADHANESPEAATKFAAEHTKECALMEECVKSGYGVYADGKWYPFDAKGNELAKAVFEKSGKKDHIKMTVEGMKHEGKILVEKITEAN